LKEYFSGNLVSATTDLMEDAILNLVGIVGKV